jgi:putative restriction endonuclease
MAVDHEERAQRAWIKLVELATSHDVCTYKELGNFIGIHHRTVRFALAPIQDYCLHNNYPPITILVVNGSGRPGQGFIAADENNFFEKKNGVFNFNWDNIENPFDLSKEGYNQEKLINNIIEKKEIPEKILQLVVARGIDQRIFRKALLKAYSGKCCICSLSVEELLEAAHIKSYSECTNEEKISVNNGLLLCANHHKLFDNEIIKINKEYKIIIINIDNKNESNRKFISFYNEHMINLPKNLLHYPDKKLLD